MTQTIKTTIIGAGAWGTSLCFLLNRATPGTDCQVWSRSSEKSLAEAVKDADVIVSAVSMKGVRSVAEQLKEIGLKDKTVIITATKGLDFETTRTPSQIWQSTFPDHAVVVLSGPNLSKEIRKGLPAATVLASNDNEAAELGQQMFASDIFRVYVNNDPIGTEMGGTLKNVIAIASGVCDGLNLGTNAKAALLTRALPEMIRVGTHLGASVETFFGLSGLGDLLATCDSPLSRNYQVGMGLSQGKSLDDIIANIEGTAEGVNTANVLIKLASREKIPVPISYQVYLLLKGKVTAVEAVNNLMARDLKEEFWFLEF